MMSTVFVYLYVRADTLVETHALLVFKNKKQKQRDLKDHQLYSRVYEAKKKFGGFKSQFQ